MEEYSSEMGQHLDNLRKAGLFCDVEIVLPADNKRLHVHRNILASCSRYFRSLFTSVMAGSGQIEVQLPGVTFADMEAILQYAYLQQARLTPDNIESVMFTADRLNVLGLLKQCTDFLATHLSHENAVGILKIARHLHCRQLEGKALRYVLVHFLQVAQHSAEFQLLTDDDLVGLFKADDLNIRSEDDACRAMLQWVAYRPETRSCSYPRLLGALRLGLVSRATIEDTLLSDQLLTENPVARELVQRGLSLSMQRENQGSDFLAEHALSVPMLRPRVPADVLFVLGGWSRDGVCSIMETYDDRVNRWYKDIPESYEHSLAYHAMVALDGSLYVVGGYTAVRYLSSARKFSAVTRTWHEVAPMHVSRCYVCAAVLDGKIYACGGFDGVNRHKSAERYTPANNQWNFIADMLTVRSDAGACELNGKIFVAGGFSGLECLSSAEMYDPCTDQWTAIEPMNFRRSGVTVVSFINSLFAIGGFNGIHRLDQVERYYPEQRAWIQVGPMRKGRSNFAAAVMDQRIFAIGGYDG
ncbi:kelch-like protein 10 isoform X2 [Pomacea canaliculata]|nr:kelch-like protein 10 isoform X2 [Pomacea canaliculata]